MGEHPISVVSARRFFVIAAILLALGVVVVIRHGVRKRRSVVVRERVADVFRGKFRCTLYYTPREAGFTAGDGFDVTPETRVGLKGGRFPKDFLLAVEKEGFGLLDKPYNGKRYIRYYGGSWGFAEQPLDTRQRPLVAKSSCAVSGKQKFLALESRLQITAANAPRDFEQLRWRVADTGGGLEETQIDLYWGEDDPLGPKKRMSHPRSAPFDLAETTVSVLR